MMVIGGNRAGRAGLGWAGPIVGRAKIRPGPKLAWFFLAKILTTQLALKTGSIGPNSLFKAKKILADRVGPGHTEPGYNGSGQIWPDFFRTNNLMAQPGPNFGRAGLAHWVRPIFPPLMMVKHRKKWRMNF